MLVGKKDNFSPRLELGSSADIILEKDGEVKYVIINGGIVWKAE